MLVLLAQVRDSLKEVLLLLLKTALSKLVGLNCLVELVVQNSGALQVDHQSSPLLGLEFKLLLGLGKILQDILIKELILLVPVDPIFLFLDCFILILQVDFHLCYFGVEGGDLVVGLGDD